MAEQFPHVQLPKGFGSFHSPSVEVLISQTEEKYQIPEVPFPLPPLPSATIQEFGGALKNKMFMLEDGWTFINHGAFGASLKPAVEVSQLWTKRMESQPLRFLDRELLPLVVHSIRRLSEFVVCDPTDLVLVPNATTALNAIFRSLATHHLTSQDLVLRLDIAYGSVKKMLEYYMKLDKRCGAQILELKIPIPIHPSQIIEAVTECLDRHAGRIKVAVFDHITSNSAVVLPIQALVEVCRKRGVMTVIDGAHGLGCLDLDLKKLDADFYVANCHKWLSNPKGCAMMYVRKQHQKWVDPVVISHGWGSGFTSNFVWTGLVDYGSWLALTYTLDCWKALGPRNIRSYIHGLAMWAADMLVSEWKTDLLADRSMYAGMVTVRLPGPRKATHEDEHNIIQDILHYKYRIEVPIKRFDDVLYVRISAHIYNYKEEYVRLARAMLEIRPNVSSPSTKLRSAL
eukprot:TRINITY_DN8402_c0_g2_i4.p1 TRINITY_DN8402_c0_g2~~TRINITY_DN8402_c0_g2_i4.p1  ORF type:complete len:481 (-),score=39.06 TRINITY_DN8402_c0_g2_i4:51-1418(-)